MNPEKVSPDFLPVHPKEAERWEILRPLRQAYKKAIMSGSAEAELAAEVALRKVSMELEFPITNLQEILLADEAEALNRKNLNN